MTLYQFNRLDELEQLEAVWEHGALVAERVDEVNRYKLYQIDAFYVEVEWHKEYNVRRAFYSFASTNAEKMKTYLDKIDISTIK
ncbi:hypothetical protein [Lacibacter sp.]|uniref:hypothetical protein n=1 Tax=Lacibacter sp. TaxID=1915409 RepID=UPI002B4B8017|nr:hypothetical protein [Lacibacter sp.]HLP39547.1 hypothetical protein [Lacibacter sp.]